MHRTSAYVLFALATLLLAQPPVVAQDHKGDSLHALLLNATTDTARVRLLERISANWINNFGDIDSTLHYTARAFALYDKLPPAQAKALRRTRIKLLEKEGFALGQKGGNEEALKRFQEGARLADELDLPNELAPMYSYMANCYRQMGDNGSVLKYTRMAMAIQEPQGESSDLALSHYGLAMYYIGEDRFDSTEYWAKKAISFFAKDQDPYRQFAAEGLLLEVYHRTRQLDSAEVHMRMQEALARQNQHPQVWMMLYGKRGRLHLLQGRYEAAMADLDSAQVISERNGIPLDRYYMSRLRGIGLAATHRMNEAFIALDTAEATMMRDMGLDKTREVTENRMRFEQEKEKAVTDAELRRQRTTTWAAIAVAALVLIIAIALWRLIRLKTRTAEELQRKNEEILRTQALLLIAEKQREAEQVRTRIARDIHDDIGASLTKIKLLSDVAVKNTPDQLEDTQRSLIRIGDHARRVSQAMSDIVWAVDPARDTHQGMIDHVRDLSQRLLGDNGIAFELDLDRTSPTSVIEPHLKRDLHLVINEAFNNILKYASAKRVIVHLLLNTYRFELMIGDDGIGFDHASITGAGNGLRNMSERMMRHGGTLTITSVPGQGTRIAAEGRL